ncbi:ribosome maturation protein RimP [Pelistega indica]|uniref:Ribosome maturation factor RimP n=1 Tax=Pelistega indica TaxID=1414851 RepID=V8G4J7_9BURK|nr:MULTISPECIES: ribosome maturation factor RimP [Pelistega]ETD70597.1 ribosome maturation protein RimP [Pelistega indica]
MADLYTLTEQAIAGLGVELIDVERAALGLLRITIDKEGGVNIEDCEQVSRLLSRVYEVENIDYKRLEVGSPGVDRPLRHLADFQRFAGEKIEVKLHTPIDNRKVFNGILSLKEGQANVFNLTFEEKKNETKVIEFAYEDVDKAKLDPVLDFKGKKK